MSIRLLVSDLDGTLLQRGRHGFSPADKQALAQASSEGITLCLASGRLYPDIQSWGSSLSLPCHSISQNGSAVYLHSGESLHTSRFGTELAQSLLRFPAATSYPRSISCNNELVYIPSDHPHLEDLRAKMTPPFLEHADLGSAFGGELSPTKFCYYGPLETLQTLQVQLQSTYGERIDALMTDVDCLDIMPSGTSKGSAVQLLAQHLGLQSEEVACVGDQFNDVSMFAKKPHRLAMGGGPAEGRAKAAYFVHSVSEVVQWVLDYNRTHD